MLKEGYFTRSASGVPVDFYGDFYWPFVRRWQGLVERRARGKMVHVEAVPNEVRSAFWALRREGLTLVLVLSCLAGRGQAAHFGLLAALVRLVSACERDADGCAGMT